MEKHTSITSYFVSGITALFGMLTLEDVALIVGIVCTIGTFAVNWYYKRKEAHAKISARAGFDS